MKDSVVFARLMEEHGSKEQEEAEPTERKKRKKGGEDGAGAGTAKKNADLMQVEERNIGAVTWDVYKRYLRYGGGLVWAPIIVCLLTLTQGAQGTLCLPLPDIGN
jgi:hypothetical protein